MADENKKKELTLFEREPRGVLEKLLIKDNIEDAVNKAFSPTGVYEDLIAFDYCGICYEYCLTPGYDSAIDALEGCLHELPITHPIIKAVYNKVNSVLEDILKMPYEEIKKCVLKETGDAIANPISTTFYVAGAFRDYSKDLFDAFKKAVYHCTNEIILHLSEPLRDLGSFEDIAFSEYPEYAKIADRTVGISIRSMLSYCSIPFSNPLIHKKEVLDFAYFLFSKNFLCDSALRIYAYCEPEKALDKFIELLGIESLFDEEKWNNMGLPRPEKIRMTEDLEFDTGREISQNTFEKGLYLEKLDPFLDCFYGNEHFGIGLKANDEYGINRIRILKGIVESLLKQKKKDDK